MPTPDSPIIPEIAVKVDPRVSVGFTTILGIGAAIGQFLGSIVLMLQDGKVDPEDLSLAVTGAITTYAVIQGRMKQAQEAIKAGGVSGSTVR
jgi:hypothetical protein